MTAKILDIDCLEPHLTGELICVRCGYRYIGCWNEKCQLKDIYCPNCNSRGYTIGTGQILESGDLSEYNKDHPKPTNKPGMILQFPQKGDRNNGRTE